MAASSHSNFDWRRVTKAAPCPICGRPDWCTVSERLVLCMRVQSNRPSHNSMGGWLHPVGQQPVKLPPKQPEAPRIDAAKVMEEISANDWPEMQRKLASSLGVSLLSLSAMGCAWSIAHHAWAFPMKSGEGHTIGIRLRNEHGKKWAVPGSRQGLFIPFGDTHKRALICEGPTDCAAALTLGYYAIGRPSCSGAIDHTRHALNRLKVKEVIIIADNDDPGAQGAATLARSIALPTATVVLPAKDLRSYLNLGGTAELLASLIDSATWKVPCATH